MFVYTFNMYKTYTLYKSEGYKNFNDPIYFQYTRTHLSGIGFEALVNQMSHKKIVIDTHVLDKNHIQTRMQCVKPLLESVKNLDTPIGIVHEHYSVVSLEWCLLNLLSCEE